MCSESQSVSEKRADSSHWPISILSSVCALYNMAMPLLLVRILTPEEIGSFKIFFLYLFLAPSLSLGSGLINGISYWSGKEESSLVRLQDSFSSLLFLATFYVGILFFFRDPIVSLSAWDAKVVDVFIVSSFAVIIGSFFEEASIARGRIWTGALFHSFFELTRTTLVLAAAYFSRDLFTVLFVFTLILFFKAIVGILASFTQRYFRLRFSKQGFRDVWRYAFPVSWAAVLGLLVHHADQLILSNYLSAREFAFYAIGCLSVPPLLILEHSVTRVLIPQLSNSFHNEDASQAKDLYSKAVEQLGFLLIPAVAGLIVFAEPIVHLLFTETYSSAQNYLALFSLTYLLLMFPYDSVPRARGEGGWILKNFALFSIVTLALCASLTYGLGATGALLGLVIGQASMRLYGLYYIQRTTSWSWSEFVPLNDLALFLTASVILSVLSIALESAFSNELYWLFVCGSGFLALYFFIVFSWQRARRLSSSTCSRVVMVTQHLEIGGLERMVLQLCQELSKNSRWELWVFAYDQEDNDESLDLKKSLEDSGVKVEMFVKPKGFSLRAVLRLVQLIVKNDIEVLHSHDMGSLIYSSAARVLSLFRVKLVHTQHSFVHIQRFKRYAFYERVFTLLVSELVVLSEQGRELYKNLGISSRRIHVIPNGIVVPDVSALQEKNQGREDIVNRYKMDALADSTWILYLARLHPVKGQMEAIESFEKLSKEYQDRAALIFVGPEAFAGERAKLTQRISHSKAKERIVYLGPSSHPEEWLRSCDIFLSCSEFEGMPLAPLEALALGKTSLVSDIAGHKFISAISMTYIAGNSADCADKLAELITAQADMSTDRENAKLRSQQFVRERYSLQTMAERYQYLYDRSVPFVRSEEAVQ